MVLILVKLLLTLIGLFVSIDCIAQRHYPSLFESSKGSSSSLRSSDENPKSDNESKQNSRESTPSAKRKKSSFCSSESKDPIEEFSDSETENTTPYVFHPGTNPLKKFRIRGRTQPRQKHHKPKSTRIPPLEIR